METKQRIIQSKLELLPKNAKYIFGEGNVKGVDTSLIETKDGCVKGEATLTLSSAINATDIIRFMEFYPVATITPTDGALTLTIEADKLAGHNDTTDTTTDHAGTERSGKYKVTLNRNDGGNDITRHTMPNLFDLTQQVDEGDIKSFTIELDT